MSKIANLLDQKFDRLVILEQSGSTTAGKATWICRCVEGNLIVATTGDLRSGKVRSCGCLGIELAKQRFTKHGLKKHPLYTVWVQMKQRCYNPNNNRYNDWGGRGITVCDEWLKNFKAFYDWAIINDYQKGLTIDRIDNNGPYAPWNCKWSTLIEQARNTRKNIVVNYNGYDQVLSEVVANHAKVNYSTVWRRLHKGLSIKEAVETVK